MLGVAVALFFVSTCFAEVTWSAKAATVQCSEATAYIQAEFPFQNAGTMPVRVVSITSSCDCLLAAADKKTYAPGENGVIRAEFGLAGRKGRQKKTIMVETDDAPGKPTVLTLIVDIAEAVVVRPRFVFWRVDEAANEKAIEITFAEPEATLLGEIQCAEPTFSVRVERLEPPGRYRIKIAPTSTATIAQATIRLNAVVEGKPRVYVLYAAVK